LGIPTIQDLPKNWDSLAALDVILRETDHSARIFDAGGEMYSMILPWLFLYGYRNLTAGNLVFTRPLRRGPITYMHADITRTSFADHTMDVVTCLSVIEHGVDLGSYFKEMSRVLKPGGLLITSTDYFETQINTRGQTAYGVPIHIFTSAEIRDGLRIAERYGLPSVAPIDLTCEDKVVHWRQFDLDYTFLNFCLKKTDVDSSTGV
jgi:SAM-dependent methyltransferase